MNYQNENENGTSFNNVCTFLSCFDSHKYSVKRCLPGSWKHAQDTEQEECDDNGKIYILKLNVFGYFESLGLLLQLKGHPNMTLKKWGMWLVDVRLYLSLYQNGLQHNTKLSTATGDPSLSAAGFLFQSLCIPPWRVAQAPQLSCQASKRFPSMCKTSVGCCGSFRCHFIPSPSTAKGSRIAGKSRAHLQQ